ncbi:unnamed protein product, partial [marine sediment metagenome]
PLIAYRWRINSLLAAKEGLHYKGVFKNTRMRDPGTPMDNGEIKMLHQLIERLEAPIRP